MEKLNLELRFLNSTSVLFLRAVLTRLTVVSYPLGHFKKRIIKYEVEHTGQFIFYITCLNPFFKTIGNILMYVFNYVCAHLFLKGFWENPAVHKCIQYDSIKQHIK